MNKKVLSLVLALVIVLGTFGTVFAAGETIDAKVQWLIDNGIVAGRTVNADPSVTDLALDKTITRAEVTKLIVYALKLQNLADILKGVIKAFPDVELTHWANGYISVATTQRADIAYGRRIIVGYPDRNFYPENNVTYGELAAMLVRIVKKDLTADMEKNAIWATSYVRWAQEEGILDGVVITDSNAPAIRRDAFAMIYNALAKLGNVNYNAAKFGDVMGIVSKVQSGIVELNQDPNMQYKITFNTMVTNGTSWASIGANAYRPGSLVRLIADADKNITHIMELGNPVELAIGDRWFDVADYTAEARNYASFGYTGSSLNTITVGGVNARIMSDTRFFVADVSNNALKEIKTLAEVFNLVSLYKFENLEDVYMGYDSYAGRNEARVIVFGDVDKWQGGSDVRRVKSYVASTYNFVAEDTKGATTVYDLRNTPLFPISYNVDFMDVVDLKLNYANNPRASVKLIDYSEDNVYLVQKLANSNREVTLEDENGWRRTYYMPSDAKVFLEGQLRTGAHVQVKFDVETVNNVELYREIEILSVVDKALDGALPDGVRVGTNSGYFVKYAYVNGVMTVTIAQDFVNGQPVNVKSYEVATTDAKFIENAFASNAQDVNKTKKIVFDVSEKYGQTPYMYNVAIAPANTVPGPVTGNAWDALYEYALALTSADGLTTTFTDDQARAFRDIYYTAVDAGLTGGTVYPAGNINGMIGRYNANVPYGTDPLTQTALPQIVK